MTKDEYFKLCTALVQEQVYAWGIASSFVCLGSPPGMADAMLLKPNWSIGPSVYRTLYNNQSIGPFPIIGLSDLGPFSIIGPSVYRDSHL